jgi:hypothetical protein
VRLLFIVYDFTITISICLALGRAKNSSGGINSSMGWVGRSLVGRTVCLAWTSSQEELFDSTTHSSFPSTAHKKLGGKTD